MRQRGRPAGSDVRVMATRGQTDKKMSVSSPTRWGALRSADAFDRVESDGEPRCRWLGGSAADAGVGWT